MVSHYEGIGGNRQKNGLLNLIMCALELKESPEDTQDYTTTQTRTHEME
jgi:hypothetical protein